MAASHYIHRNCDQTQTSDFSPQQYVCDSACATISGTGLLGEIQSPAAVYRHDSQIETRTLKNQQVGPGYHKRASQAANAGKSATLSTPSLSPHYLLYHCHLHWQCAQLSGVLHHQSDVGTIHDSPAWLSGFVVKLSLSTLPSKEIQLAWVSTVQARPGWQPSSPPQAPPSFQSPDKLPFGCHELFRLSRQLCRRRG